MQLQGFLRSAGPLAQSSHKLVLCPCGALLALWLHSALLALQPRGALLVPWPRGALPAPQSRESCGRQPPGGPPRHPPTHPMVGPRACSPVARPSSHRGTRSLAKLTPTRHQPRRPAWQTSVSSSLTRRAPAGPRGPRSGFPGLVRVSPRPGPLSRIWKPGP